MGGEMHRPEARRKVGDRKVVWDSLLELTLSLGFTGRYDEGPYDRLGGMGVVVARLPFGLEFDLVFYLLPALFLSVLLLFHSSLLAVDLQDSLRCRVFQIEGPSCLQVEPNNTSRMVSSLDKTFSTKW